jgi:DNA repair ATPase RecN
MRKLLFLLIIGTVAGCSSVKREVFKARQIFDKYPNEAAKYCGDKFPVADSTISVKSDTAKGKEVNYKPAFTNLELLLDSAKEILDQKQYKITDLAQQLNFTKGQLSKANNLSVQLSNIKANYKPCGVDTIKNTITKIRANAAKILTLTAQTVQDGQDKEKLQKALQDENTKSLRRLYWVIGLCLLIAAYFGIKIYGFFSGGGIVRSVFHNMIKR